MDEQVWRMVARRRKKEPTSDANTQPVPPKGRGRRKQPRPQKRRRQPQQQRKPPQQRQENQPQRKYDAYNATSRSVELPDGLPRYFFTRDQSIGHRGDIEVKGSRVFAVHDFLSKEECDFLVASLEKIGFAEHSDLAAEYPPEYRNNERLIVLSQPLAGNCN